MLLNLDPAEDPLAGILMVDFFALRARENQWLVDFYNTFQNKRCKSFFIFWKNLVKSIYTDKCDLLIIFLLVLIKH